MRYRLALTIRYDFDHPSGAGRQLLRVCPADLPGVQRVQSCAVTVAPEALEQRSFRDFFGTTVVEVVLPAGLSEVEFKMTAEVTRDDPGAMLDLSGPPGGLANELAQVGDLGPASPHHFLPASPRIPQVPEIAAYAALVTKDAKTVRGLVEQLGMALHRDMKFDAKATEVDTPIAEAFAGRHGVCQDFSQIMVAGLRSLGVPGAYVSGYLRTLPPKGKPRLVGADAMHAWVRAWTGAEGGWVDFDPTNACLVGADHVTVGWGRDYSDAAPIIGMVRLEGAQSGKHSVDLEAI